MKTPRSPNHAVSQRMAARQLLALCACKGSNAFSPALSYHTYLKGRGANSLKNSDHEINLQMRRLSIAFATSELCEGTSLRSVGIDDICAKVGISRSSFYRAFADKYDIAVWCHLLPLENGVGQMGRTLTCSDGVCTTLEGISLFKGIFKSLDDAPGLFSVEEEGRRHAAELMRETLSEWHGVEIDDNIRFAIDWITDASTSASMRWVASETPVTAEKMADRFRSCYPESLLRYFDNPPDPKGRTPFGLSSYFSSAMNH